MIGTLEQNALVLGGFVVVGAVLYLTRRAGKETIVHTRDGNTNTLRRWSQKVDRLADFKKQLLQLYILLLLGWLVSLLL